MDSRGIRRAFEEAEETNRTYHSIQDHPPQSLSFMLVVDPRESL